MRSHGQRVVVVVAASVAWIWPHALRASPAPIPAEPPLEGALWSIVVPALLLILASLATWLLYRRFSRQ
jgi:hypothetical protein